MMMQPDDPPFLSAGTEVSAKYKGAFCEAKVNKVVKNVKIKVTYKGGLSSQVVSDDEIRGVLKVGSAVKAIHPEKSGHHEALIAKIQDCSQYTVVFDDGDITTLRRTSLCLKSGRHFAESESLDQLPLTHPEHFGSPVVGGSSTGRRGGGRRHKGKIGSNLSDSECSGSSDEEDDVHKTHISRREEWEQDIGKVVCVEGCDNKKKQRDNWFPALVVAPTAQDTVRIDTRKDYLVRSFQDGRYYTVPKKEATAFTKEAGSKASVGQLKVAVDKVMEYLDTDALPPHWDRDLLFGMNICEQDTDGTESDESDDEPREEKDHFVAQLYKYMEECNTPINKAPTVANRFLDLYRLYKVVQKLGGFNRALNQNQLKVVVHKMNLSSLGPQGPNLIKAAYKKYLLGFEDFFRKLGCTMVSTPRRMTRIRPRSGGRSLIRDCDRVDKSPHHSSSGGRGPASPAAGSSSPAQSGTLEVEPSNLTGTVVTSGGEKCKVTVTAKGTGNSKKDATSTSSSTKKSKDIKKEETADESPSFRDIKTYSRITRQDRPASQSPERSVSTPPASPLPPSRPRSAMSGTRGGSRSDTPTGRSSSSRRVEDTAASDDSAVPASSDVRTRSRAADGSKKENSKEESESELDNNNDEEDDDSQTTTDNSLTKVQTTRTRSSRLKDDAGRDKPVNAAGPSNQNPNPTTRKASSSSSLPSSLTTPSTSSPSITPSSRKKLLSHSSSVEQDTTVDSDSQDNESTHSSEGSNASGTKKGRTVRAVGGGPGRPGVGGGGNGATKPVPSLSSTSSCSSSSSSSSSSTSSTVKQEETEGKVVKRGRKKRLEGEVIVDADTSSGRVGLAPYIPVAVGDKLLVFYGPSPKQTKVTYEAKVIEVSSTGASNSGGPASLMYYVHYQGWNNRYDEWIKRCRIAKNLSYTPHTRQRHSSVSSISTAAASTSTGPPCIKKELNAVPQVEGSTSITPSTLSAISSAAVNNIGNKCRAAKSAAAISGTDDGVGTRSKAPGEKLQTSDDNSKGTLEAPTVVTRRRRRRKAVPASADEDDSDSCENTDSEMEADSRPVREAKHLPSVSEKKANSNSSTTVSSSALGKEKTVETTEVNIKEEVEDGGSSDDGHSCGKDIDLKEIESEMKGLDKPIKKEEEAAVSVTPAPHAYDGPRLQRLNMEKKQQQQQQQDVFISGTPKKSNEVTPTKKRDLSPKSDLAKSVKGGDPFEDDIYEFKEPEPFEIGEMRSRKDGRNSKGGLSSPQEEEAENSRSGKKKQIKREIDTDTSESENDTCSPAKKPCWDAKDGKKETPVKKEYRPSPLKKEPLPEGESKKEKRETAGLRAELVASVVPTDDHTTPPAVVSASVVKTIIQGPNTPSPHKKVTPKKDPVLPKPLHAISATDIKVVKLDITASGSPLSKLSQGEVVGKVTSIARPKIDLQQQRTITATHIMAQVLPPKQSKALAKAVPKEGVSSRGSSPAEPLKQQQYSTTSSSSNVVPVPTQATQPDVGVPTAIPIEPLKLEDKADPKSFPFIKRQQHIFPHLLNCPGGAEPPIVPPQSTEADKVGATASDPTTKQLTNVTQPPRSASPNAEHRIPVAVANASPEVKQTASTSVVAERSNVSDSEKSKASSSVGESIESVIQKARMKTLPSGDESARTTPEKRKKTPLKYKKDDPDDSESEPTIKNDLVKNKKMKTDDNGSISKSVKKEHGVKKQLIKKAFEENTDGDSESCDNSIEKEANIATKQLRKKMPQRGSSTPKKLKEQAVCTPEREEKVEEPEETETDASETGIGELLCEETIPPGSPMAHDVGEAELSDNQYSMISSSYNKRHQHPLTHHHHQAVHTEIPHLITAPPLLARANNAGHNNQLHGSSHGGFMRHHVTHYGSAARHHHHSGLMLGNRWSATVEVAEEAGGGGAGTATLLTSSQQSSAAVMSPYKGLCTSQSAALVIDRETSTQRYISTGAMTTLAAAAAAAAAGDDDNTSGGKSQAVSGGGDNNSDNKNDNNNSGGGGGSTERTSGDVGAGDNRYGEGSSGRAPAMAGAGQQVMDIVPTHASLENSLPTTPESMSSNITDSPTRDDDPSVKAGDDSSAKSGRDSSELEGGVSEAGGTSAGLVQGPLPSTSRGGIGTRGRRRTIKKPDSNDPSSSSFSIGRCSAGDQLPSTTRDSSKDTEGGGSKRRKRIPRLAPHPIEEDDNDDSNHSRRSTASSNSNSRKALSGGRSKANVSSSLTASTSKKKKRQSTRWHPYREFRNNLLNEDGTLKPLEGTFGGNPSPYGRFNFLTDCDYMSRQQRIEDLTRRMTFLRKLYSELKSKAASLERKMKKMKKREKENRDDVS